MMFSLKGFLKEGFIKAVGNMADYQIILNAAGWYDKGVFDEADLKEIQSAINDHYTEQNTDIESAEEINEDNE